MVDISQESVSSVATQLLAGPAVMSLLVSWWLYGVLTIQAYMYYISFPRDQPWLKAVAYGLFLVETLQTMMNTSDSFHWVVYGFGNLRALHDIHLVWFDMLLLGGLVTGFVQIFFAWRIWHLGRSPILPVVILVVALAQAVSGVVAGVQSRAVGDVAELRDKVAVSLLIWSGGNVIADALIAVSMTHLLLRLKSRANDNSVSALVRVFVETNIVTTVFAVAVLVTFLAIPGKTVFFSLSLIMSKVSSIAFFTGLNQRVNVQSSQNSKNFIDLGRLSSRNDDQPVPYSFAPGPDKADFGVSYKPHGGSIGGDEYVKPYGSM